MGLLWGWWGVGAVAVVAIFLILELMKFMRGTVHLSARQKVVRPLGGILLMVIVLMTVFSPLVLKRRPGMAHLSFDIIQLVYWGTALGLAVMLLLLAMMDLSEVNRNYIKSSRAMRRGTLTREDIERLVAGERPERPDRKDNPEDIGRGPDKT